MKRYQTQLSFRVLRCLTNQTVRRSDSIKNLFEFSKGQTLKHQKLKLLPINQSWSYFHLKPF